MNSADIKQLWQRESLDSLPPSPEATQQRAFAFARHIRRRNFIEYAAAALVVAAFGYYAWTEGNPIVRLGDLFIVAAAFYVVWQLGRRTTPRRPPVAPTLVEAIDHLRGEFARQHEALVHIWDWYLLPFVPGFVLIMVGPGIMPEASATPPIPIAGFVTLVIVLLVFYGVWRANRAAARMLRKAVEELDAMREELE